MVSPDDTLRTFSKCVEVLFSESNRTGGIIFDMGGKGHSCGKLAYMVLWGAGEMVRFHTTECPLLGRLKKNREAIDQSGAGTPWDSL